MKLQFYSITKKITLLILCCLAQLIVLAQQPQVIKARAYDTQSTYIDPLNNTSSTENDKNWALSIIETTILNNNGDIEQEGFGVAGFRTRFRTKSEFVGALMPGTDDYDDAEEVYEEKCATPGEDCTFKQPTILKLKANLDEDWAQSWDMPRSSQLVAVAQAGGYLYGGGQHYICRTGLSAVGTPLIWGLETEAMDCPCANNANNLIASNTLDKIRFSELIYKPNSRVIAIGTVEINPNSVVGGDAFLFNDAANNPTPSDCQETGEIRCPGYDTNCPVKDCEVQWGNALLEMAIFEFDTNLNLLSIHIIGRDSNGNLALIDLLALYNPATNQYDFTDPDKNINEGLEAATGIELSYSGGTMPDGIGMGNIDGYVINGTLSEIHLNDPSTYENADRVALIAKIDIDGNGNMTTLGWHHRLSHVAPYNDYDNDNVIEINPPMPTGDTRPDCQILAPGGNVPANNVADINSVTSTIGFKCIQDSGGDYIFTVGARYLDVTTNVRQGLDCSINTNFNTFFRQADVYLIKVNNDPMAAVAVGEISNSLHLGQFTGEDFVPEILETYEKKTVYTDDDNDCMLEAIPNVEFNQYVINGAVSNNSVIDPLTFGGLENAGRFVFVDKSTFTIAKDYPFFEGLNDLWTFSTDYTSNGHIVVCANNNANFDDYAIMEICPNYGDEDPNDCIPLTCDCLNGALLPTHETVYDQGVPNSMNNRTEIDGGTPDRSATQTFSRITVKSGTTLTIKNITIELSERIVVETGAKLIVDNATLTATCDNLIWVGIEVYGNPAWGHPSNSSSVLSVNYPNNLEGQGVVIIKNSTIEYAQNGVKTKHKSSDPTHDDHNGIVLVENSIFLNNVCGVVLIGNDAPVVSDLLNTQFIINDDFRTGNSGVEVPITQVRLKNVSNYKIMGKNGGQNTFISHQEEYGKSKAIWTDDSDFILTDTHFTNFDYGIYAANGLAALNKQTLVEDCTFNDNAHSMVFSGYHADIDDGDGEKDRGDFGLFIYNNIVNMREALQGHFDYAENNWGIRLEACRDYMVSTNFIDGGYQYDPTELEDQSSLYTSGYAIQANDSPSIMDQTNYIQKNLIGVNPNIITALHSGLQAWNDNPSLQILCNTFTNKMFYAENYGVSPANVPVALSQGSCGQAFDPREPETAPAGNTFSANQNSTLGTGHRNFIMNGSNSLDVMYHYTGVQPSNNSSRLILDPCDNTPAVNCNSFENDQPYVQAVSGGTACPILQEDISVFEKIEDEILQNMALLTSYGRLDKSGIISAAISIAQIQKAISFHDVFLSDNELIALSNRIGEFPVDVLTILEENAPLTNEVLEALSVAISNVPVRQQLLIIKNQAIVDNLFENTTGFSLRDEKEREVRQLATIQLSVPTKYVPQDCTKKIKPDEVLENLVYLSKNTALNKLPIQQFVLDESIKARNFDLAKETLNAIEIGDNENLKCRVLLKQFEIDMLQAGKTVYTLDKRALATLKDLASDNDYAGIIARNALLSTTDETTPLFTPETEEPKAENVKKVAKPLLALNDDDSFVHPNPGNDVISIDVGNFATQTDQLMIKIYNSGGYLISKLIKTDDALIDYDVSEIPPGAYIIEVTDKANNLRKQTKLIIAR